MMEGEASLSIENDSNNFQGKSISGETQEAFSQDKGFHKSIFQIHWLYNTIRELIEIFPV